MRQDQSETIEWPDAGFPGIKINPLTLTPEIVDQDSCDAALRTSTDPADPIFVLIVQGHTAEAADLLAEARYKDPESFPLRAFEAEILRVSHRYDRAIDLFRQLQSEFAGTPTEALVLHYLGRAHYVSGRPAAAVEAFSRALDMRVASAADAAQIYSSTVALQRARQMVEITG